MGRYDEANYPQGHEGDYLIVTDAIDEHLTELVHDDDVAEPCIYAQAIEWAGDIIRCVIQKNEAGTNCILCGNRFTSNPHLHDEDCPLLHLASVVAASDALYDAEQIREASVK